MFTVYLKKLWGILWTAMPQDWNKSFTHIEHRAGASLLLAMRARNASDTRVTGCEGKRQWEAENLARFLLPAFLCAQIFIARHTSGYEVVAGAVLAEGIWFSKCWIQLTVSKDAFHLSELSGQTIPVIIRISSFNQNYPVRPVRCQIACSKEIVFQQKLLEKSIFHCQNDWFCYDPVGQFWLLESVLRRTMSVLQRVK